VGAAFLLAIFFRYCDEERPQGTRMCSSDEMAIYFNGKNPHRKVDAHHVQSLSSFYDWG
jgi:hypothetical protein